MISTVDIPSHKDPPSSLSGSKSTTNRPRMSGPSRVISLTDDAEREPGMPGRNVMSEHALEGVEHATVERR